MNIYEDENVVVKESTIEGLGLFANRPFKKDEVVLKWNPKILTAGEVQGTPAELKRFINKLEDGTSALMQIPERYVNHSDNPNTKPVGSSDVALRDIEIGEEITSNYEFEKTEI